MTLSGRSALFVVIGGIASLCLSLFLIGLMVGGIWREHPRHFWGEGPMAMRERPEDGRPDGPGRGGAGGFPMPPEIRAELKEILAPHEAEIDQTRAAMRDARIAVGKALATEPFDPNAFKAALENMQQKGVAMQNLMHDLMLEAVPKLKPELRQRWAERWMSPHGDLPPPPGDAPPPDNPTPPAQQ
ncbi:MAG TPA: periplasmic heavy metal sensor [Dongiaceae bacterium]|nr:periplasmic heavy metal sensor [Dongiaceae bacterium]